MRQIETKLLGRTNRRLDPANGIINFTPIVDSQILAKAEVRGARDGFPYLKDVILVLFGLYGQGTLGPKLRRALPKMIAEWMQRPGSEGQNIKRNFKLRRHGYDRALERWQKDAPEQARSATAMFAFLLESYGDGKIELALRLGNGES